MDKGSIPVVYGLDVKCVVLDFTYLRAVNRIIELRRFMESRIAYG